MKTGSNEGEKDAGHDVKARVEKKKLEHKEHNGMKVDDYKGHCGGPP